MMPDVRGSSMAAVRIARLFAGVLAGVGVLLAGPGAAQAKPSPTPAAGHQPQAALSIAVTDGVSDAAPGDRLVYGVTVRNDGDAASRRVTVRLTLPGGVSFVSADGGGVSERGAVVWKVAVPAAGHVTVTARGTVGTLLAGLNGLAGVACVNAGGPDMLCSSDIDQIPGRGDVHAVTRASVDTVAPVWDRRRVVAVGLAVVAALGGLVLLAVRRRRRGRTAR